MSIERDNTPMNQREWKEKQIEHRVMALVRAHEGIAYKFTSPSRASVPDRLICLPGVRPFFMELKAWGKIPTPGQFREAERLLKLGNYVYFIDNIGDATEVVTSALADDWESGQYRSPPHRAYREFWEAQ